MLHSPHAGAKPPGLHAPASHPAQAVIFSHVGRHLPSRARNQLAGVCRVVSELLSTEAALGAVTAEQPLTPADGPIFEAKDWAACFASQRLEFDYWVHEVEGSIPTDLNGTLFRNGPGMFERGQQHYQHMLDGDGYVCSFSFAPDGRVRFKSRYVRTREFLEEERADQVLYRNTFGTQRPGGALRNAFNLKLKNPANTNVLCWGNRLLALWEAGAPYELHPYTLDTRPNPVTLDGFVLDGLAPSSTGNSTLDRVLGFGSALTAHPHIEPARDGQKERLIIWKWISMTRLNGEPTLELAIAEYDPLWRKLKETPVQLRPAVFNPHDFALTPRFFLFFQSPTAFDMMPYLLGMKGPAQCVDLSDDDLRVNVFPRDGGQPIVLDTERCFLIHHANAYEDPEDPDVIECWSSGWGPEGLGALAKGSGMLGSWKVVLQGDFEDIPLTSIWRHRINTRTREVTREVLFDEQNADHPKVNPHFYSRPTRFCYFNCGHHTQGRRSMPPQAFARLDTHTGEVQTWHPGSRAFCEELVFVPGQNGDTVEDDGYLLGMVFDAAVNRSCLVIMDASDFNKGPIAKVWLTHHVPHGLHGCYSNYYFGP